MPTNLPVRKLPGCADIDIPAPPNLLLQLAVLALVLAGLFGSIQAGILAVPIDYPQFPIGP